MREVEALTDMLTGEPRQIHFRAPQSHNLKAANADQVERTIPILFARERRYATECIFHRH